NTDPILVPAIVDVRGWWRKIQVLQHGLLSCQAEQPQHSDLIIVHGFTFFRAGGPAGELAKVRTSCTGRACGATQAPSRPVRFCRKFPWLGFARVLFPLLCLSSSFLAASARLR